MVKTENVSLLRLPETFPPQTFSCNFDRWYQRAGGMEGRCAQRGQRRSPNICIMINLNQGIGIKHPKAQMIQWKYVHSKARVILVSLLTQHDLRSASLLGLWLRSKCSICSYQLDIWYGDHVSPSILNWFLKGDEVQELAPASSRVGLALQYRQDRLTPHFLMKFYHNVAAWFTTPEWVSSGLRSIAPTQSCRSHHLKSSEHVE